MNAAKLPCIPHLGTYDISPSRAGGGREAAYTSEVPVMRLADIMIHWGLLENTGDYQRLLWITREYYGLLLWIALLQGCT